MNRLHVGMLKLELHRIHGLEYWKRILPIMDRKLPWTLEIQYYQPTIDYGKKIIYPKTKQDKCKGLACNN